MIPAAKPEVDVNQFTRAATASATAITVVPLETPTLGDRSYLVHDGDVAFVIDPQRDIDRILVLLDLHGVRLTQVFESHIHNDYVTGGFALAERTGAAYLVNAEDAVSFERTPVRGGEVLRIGPRMRVSAPSSSGARACGARSGSPEQGPQRRYSRVRQQS